MSRSSEARGPDYQSVLAVNLRRLVAHQTGGSVNAWSARHKLPQSTINKICTGQRSATLTVLEQIQAATGYAPWQLLHPEFNPVRMPPMMDGQAMRVAAIYAHISNPLDKKRAEAIMEQFAPGDEAQFASDTTEQQSHSQ